MTVVRTRLRAVSSVSRPASPVPTAGLDALPPIVGRPSCAGKRSSGFQVAQGFLPTMTPFPSSHLPPGDPPFSQAVFGPRDPVPRPTFGLDVPFLPSGGDLPAGRHQMADQAFTRSVGQHRIGGSPPSPLDEEVATVIAAFRFRHAFGPTHRTPVFGFHREEIETEAMKTGGGGSMGPGRPPRRPSANP